MYFLSYACLKSERNFHDFIKSIEQIQKGVGRLPFGFVITECIVSAEKKIDRVKIIVFQGW